MLWYQNVVSQWWHVALEGTMFPSINSKALVLSAAHFLSVLSSNVVLIWWRCVSSKTKMAADVPIMLCCRKRTVCALYIFHTGREQDDRQQAVLLQFLVWTERWKWAGPHPALPTRLQQQRIPIVLDVWQQHYGRATLPFFPCNMAIFISTKHSVAMVTDYLISFASNIWTRFGQTRKDITGPLSWGSVLGMLIAGNLKRDPFI